VARSLLRAFFVSGPQGNLLIMLADEINVTCPRVIDLGTRLDSTRGGLLGVVLFRLDDY